MSQTTATLSKAAWLDRFTMHVGKLLPSMKPADASCYGEETFLEASDLSPEEAAEIFALEIPPGEPGAREN